MHVLFESIRFRIDIFDVSRISRLIQRAGKISSIRTGGAAGRGGTMRLGRPDCINALRCFVRFRAQPRPLQPHRHVSLCHVIDGGQFDKVWTVGRERIPLRLPRPPVRPARSREEEQDCLPPLRPYMKPSRRHGGTAPLCRKQQLRRSARYC